MCHSLEQVGNKMEQSAPKVRGRVSAELRAQILKEVQEVGIVTTVAKRYGMSSKTIHNWLHGEKHKDQINETKKIKELSKQLKNAEFEVEMLRALLKKTYPRWQNAENL
jgi:transposase-like protein